ncbi:formyltransferase family protein [Halodesulfovibrio aestuarii]|uniref:methionyl-tRNA formyltransferase n=1 Tax=Halodesulfovibrio aestuarii TaxID=126333 RepID=UPI000413165E
MRIGFIGCVESSLFFLKKLLPLRSEGIELTAVVTKEASSFNSDYADLVPLCMENNIPVHFEKSGGQRESFDFFKQYCVDVVYCFGWSFLLKEEMLSLGRFGAYGFHPAKLPMNRGRHPLIWALALGLTETASTFFKMDCGADSGPIISQESIRIQFEDDARSLYNKVLTKASCQLVDFTRRLADGSATLIEQDESKATYWRKRSVKDGQIDWRMSATDIYNLVRALSTPYPGAEFVYQDKKIVVFNSRISKRNFPQSTEPGRVIAVQKNDVLIKTAGTGAIWLLQLDTDVIFNKGDCL